MDWFWKRTWGKKDYLMHKGLFFFLSIIVLGLFFWTLASINDNSLHVYVSCPPNAPTNPFGYGGCRNPLFNSPDCGVKIPSDSVFCTTEHLAAGQSLGVPAPLIYDYFWFLVFGVIVLVLGLNHWLFNKDFFKGFKGGLE